MNKNDSQRLFGRLRQALFEVDQIVGEIIESKAWEPLGYESFVDAWKGEMYGEKLSPRVEAAIVYAMLDTGATESEIALSVHGVGPVKAKGLAKAYKAGQEPKDAQAYASSITASERRQLKPGETVVEAHIRKKPERVNGVHLTGFSDEEMLDWKQFASDRNLDFEKLAKDALREGFRFLKRGGS